MSAFRMIAAAVVLLAASAGLAADRHALVQVDLTVPGAAEWLQDHRTEYDIVFAKPGSYAHVAATADELRSLRAAGLDLKVVEEDLEASYAADKGVGFGIFHTYSESEAWMDSLHALYPNVISAKWSIGQSGQGRDIWCFRVSDNPEVDESEPEVLIDGMHHAREIMASEFPVMFAEYLAQNYGVDPELTWLVDNRELYIIPIVNPDGFVYNETTDPNGGGMWRKNRRNNGDGTYGVDLNRNYPYQWGYNDSGSSPYGSSDTYRGPSAGSEPETQAMMAFINSREIRTHDSVHTYSNLLLFPWGYTYTHSPDHAAFTQMADIMTQYNNYEGGTPPDLLYDVNGGSIDWMYGATTEHDEIISFSTEIGGSSDGFWPAESRRGPLFEENVWPHVYLMRAAGPAAGAHTAVALDGTGGSLDAGESGTLTFTVENQSAFSSLTSLSVALATDDPWVQLGAASRTVGPLAPMTGDDLTGDPIPVSVDAGCPDGHLVTVNVTLGLADGDMVVPLAFRVGNEPVILSEDFESGTDGWTLTGLWGLTSESANSPNNSLTDTPNASYSNNTATSARTTAAYEASKLVFWHRYSIESGWDYGYVQVSTNGTTWSNLDVFSGYDNTWTRKEYDLAAYAGQPVYIRFLLETDYSVTYDGWMIDDVTLYGSLSENGIPGTPALLDPADGATVSMTPQLVVSNQVDPEGADVVYGFRVYSDAACTQLAASAGGVAEGEGSTSWLCDALAPGTYYWRAWAGDGVDRSPLSPAGSFVVSDVTAVGLPIGGPRLTVLGSVSGGQAGLRLALPAAADVTVDVHDVRGALVRRLHSGRMGGGESTLYWDGRDAQGRDAASGVYLVRMRAGDEVATGRLVMVK